MTVCMAMVPPPSGNAETDAERIVFIKEGFNWPAFFFAVPWLMIRGLWLVLVGYLVVALLVAGAGELVGGPGPWVGGLALSLLFGLESNGLRRWTLERRGWSLAAVVSGAGRDDCETRFFENWSAATEPPGATSSGSGSTPRTSDAPTMRSATPSDEVIGLFPEATR